MADQEDHQAWLVNKDDLIFHDVLNDDVGSTAIVYLAHFRPEVRDGRAVAVKEIQDIDDSSVIHRELTVLTNAVHPNIVQLYGVVVDQCPVQLCLEYCEGGSLFELLHITYTIPLCWRQRLVMLYDTAVAIDYLHSFDPKIVHRDLKSLNILLLHRVPDATHKPHIKVCDFGFAREHEPGAIMTKGAGTLQWMAPEVSSSTDYTEAADIFSFAIVAFEVVCRRTPSIKAVRNDQYNWAIRQGHRPDLHDPRYLPEIVPVGLLELVMACWAQHPPDRPSFNEIWQELARIIHETPDSVKLHVPRTGVESI